jgi:hypothetical protein
VPVKTSILSLTNHIMVISFVYCEVSLSFLVTGPWTVEDGLRKTKFPILWVGNTADPVRVLLVSKGSYFDYLSLVGDPTCLREIHELGIWQGIFLVDHSG